MIRIGGAYFCACPTGADHTCVPPPAPPEVVWHPPATVAARVAERDCQVCHMGHAEITRQHHNGNH